LLAQNLFLHRPFEAFSVHEYGDDVMRTKNPIPKSFPFAGDVVVDLILTK